MSRTAIHTGRRIANLLNQYGKTSGDDLVGWGFTADEIKSAVTSGAIVRAAGSVCGASVTRYYRAA